MRQINVLILVKWNMKSMPDRATLGITFGEPGEQQKIFSKVLNLSSYRILFLFWKKSLQKNLTYLWHYKSLFWRKLKFGNADIILSSNYQHIFIYQYRNSTSQRIRVMSTDLMLINNQPSRASPIHDNLDFQINSQH